MQFRKNTRCKKHNEKQSEPVERTPKKERERWGSRRGFGGS